ncbi:hypothetical protein RHECNPAF_4460027 [Rhizobium etli CNPAF512]|nr:hypothetical protein RHECNPAF_4460027 [Rhizobium etli CNPAF512]
MPASYGAGGRPASGRPLSPLQNLLAGGPAEATPQDQRHVGMIEFGRDMAESRIEDAAGAEMALEDNRHHDIAGRRIVCAGEGRGRQDFDSGIVMQVILLRMVVEVGNALHNRIVLAGDRDAEVDNVAGMGDPCDAGDIAERCAFLEGGGKRPVMAGKPEPATHRFDQTKGMIFLKLFASDDRHQQIGFRERRRSEYAEIAGHLDRKAVFAQEIGDDMGALLRLVTLPAAPDDQCLPHSRAPWLIAADTWW